MEICEEPNEENDNSLAIALYKMKISDSERSINAEKITAEKIIYLSKLGIDNYKLSYDGKTLLISDNKELKVIFLSKKGNWTIKKRLKIDTHALATEIDFSPDSSMFVFASGNEKFENNIYIYDTEKIKLKYFSGNLFSIPQKMKFSPDCSKLITIECCSLVVYNLNDKIISGKETNYRARCFSFLKEKIVFCDDYRIFSWYYMNGTEPNLISNVK
jgi:tricorn protease-like protein